MATKAPDPLVDADVDLRDFPFMPVDITRLFGSEFNAVSDDATWRAGFTLWLKSYHQVPASSVSGNDLALARLCEIAPEKWKKIKRGALRGWIKCSDGRWYHPVVAEKALEGWIEKLTQRKSSASGNASRYGHEFDPKHFDASIDRAKEQLAKLNPRSKTLSKKHGKYRTLPAGSDPAPGGSPDGTPGGSEPAVPSGSQEKGREGKGREEDKYLSQERAQCTQKERDLAFARFQEAYPGEIAYPDEAKRALNARLDEGVVIDDIVNGAKRFAAKCTRDKLVGRFIKAPHSWLEGGGWKGGAKPATEPIASGRTFVKADGDHRWPALAERFLRENGKQPPKMSLGGADGWHFPDEWIETIRESVPA